LSRVDVASSERMRRTQASNSISLSRHSSCVTVKPAPLTSVFHSTRPRQRTWLGSESFFEVVEQARPFAQFIRGAPGNKRIVGRDIIHERKGALRQQHAKGLADEVSHAVEVMRGEAADDEITARVGEGKILGLCRESSDIGQASSRCKLLRFGKHLRGDVGRRDLGNIWGKGEGGVACAGRHVEHAPMGLGLSELDEARKTSALAWTSEVA
jgi:hypothetical protein